MRISPEKAFEEWFDDDKEECLYDVTGGDWEDNVFFSFKAFRAGWYAALDNLTTRDT